MYWLFRWRCLSWNLKLLKFHIFEDDMVQKEWIQDICLTTKKKLPLNPLKGTEQANEKFVRKIKDILKPKLLLKGHNTWFVHELSWSRRLWVVVSYISFHDLRFHQPRTRWIKVFWLKSQNWNKFSKQSEPESDKSADKDESPNYFCVFKFVGHLRFLILIDLTVTVPWKPFQPTGNARDRKLLVHHRAITVISSAFMEEEDMDSGHLLWQDKTFLCSGIMAVGKDGVLGRQACSPLIQLFFGFASEWVFVNSTNITTNIETAVLSRPSMQMLTSVRYQQMF